MSAVSSPPRGCGRPAAAASGPPRATPRSRRPSRTLVDPQTRGDPTSPLVWTTKSTRNLADALAGRAHRVSDRTVARMLRAQAFSLQANAKVTEVASTPTGMPSSPTSTTSRPRSLVTGDPAVSGGHKEEGIGRRIRQQRPRVAARRAAGAGERPRLPRPECPRPSHTASTTWPPTPASCPWAWITTPPPSPPTPCVPGGSTVGAKRYPNSDPMLITADAGGSNGYRLRAWKVELAKLAVEIGRDITVVPLPSRHIQVEQDRTPSVLLHLHQLARPAADRIPGHHRHHLRHHHRHRTDRRSHARRQHLPDRRQVYQDPD